MFTERFVAHEQSEMSACGEVPAYELGRGRDDVGDREYLVGGGDVVGRSGEQVERHRDVREVDPASANSYCSIDQFVIAEQMADDPQVEASRDVLGVLEPVLELAVAGDVVLVI